MAVEWRGFPVEDKKCRWAEECSAEAGVDLGGEWGAEQGRAAMQCFSTVLPSSETAQFQMAEWRQKDGWVPLANDHSQKDYRGLLPSGSGLVSELLRRSS